jgi:hypothetical protein
MFSTQMLFVYPKLRLANFFANSNNPILSSARASSSGVTVTEGTDAEVDEVVMAEVIQLLC